MNYSLMIGHGGAASILACLHVHVCYGQTCLHDQRMLASERSLISRIYILMLPSCSHITSFFDGLEKFSVLALYGSVAFLVGILHLVLRQYHLLLSRLELRFNLTTRMYALRTVRGPFGPNRGQFSDHLI
jgi:hypothetical protein